MACVSGDEAAAFSSIIVVGGSYAVTNLIVRWLLRD